MTVADFQYRWKSKAFIGQIFLILCLNFYMLKFNNLFLMQN